MKKIAVVAAGLAVLSTSAFATRARMEALGQNQAQGSYFMRDSRTIFRNASHINDQKNFIVAELGDSQNANDGTNGQAEAEGGFVKDAGKFVYGVMLNFQRDDASAAGTVDIDADGATNGANDLIFLGEDERIDLFFGGDAGIQWGLNISYAYQKDERLDDNDSGTAREEDGKGSTYNYLGVNLGMTMGDLEAWLNMDINEETEGSLATGQGVGAGTSSVDPGNTFEGDFAFQIGASYAIKDHVVYFEYDRDGYEAQNIAFKNNENTDFTETVFTLGVAKMMEINEKSRWFWDIVLTLDEQETTQNTRQASTDNNDLRFTVGFESDVRSWLTLRGSVGQNVGYSRNDVDNTGANTLQSDDDSQFSTTVANAGATIKLGDIMIDGVLGVNDQDGAAGNFQKNGRLGFGDNFFGRAAVTYNF